MDLSSFFGVLRRRVLIIAVAVIVVGAYLVSKGQDEKYEATADLLLEGAGEGEELGAPLPEGAADREALVTRGEVLQRAERTLAQRIGQPRAAAAIGDVTAFSAEDSEVVELTAAASGARTAALAANTLAQANIDFRRARTLREIRRARRASERELQNLDPSDPTDAAALSVAQQELSSIRGAASTVDGDAEIVQRATPPDSRSSPKPQRNGLIGALGGLLLGLALALMLEQLDRRVRHSKRREAFSRESRSLLDAAGRRGVQHAARRTSARGRRDRRGPPGKTTRDAVTQLRNQLQNLDAPTLGVVVNALGSDAEGYGYGYGYTVTGPRIARATAAASSGT